MKDVKADQFKEEDFKEINEYICKRGASSMLAVSVLDDDGELTISGPGNLLGSEKIKRDIAYVIKGIRAKKRLQNDFEPRSSRDDLSPDDFIEDFDFSRNTAAESQINQI